MTTPNRTIYPEKDKIISTPTKNIFIRDKDITRTVSPKESTFIHKYPTETTIKNILKNSPFDEENKIGSFSESNDEVNVLSVISNIDDLQSEINLKLNNIKKDVLSLHVRKNSFERK